jgi:predicted nucleotidyltransferase
MCTEKQLDNILNAVLKFSTEKFGERLCDVILYGSYARGDFDNESDIDILVLVSADIDEIKRHETDFSTFSSRLDLSYDVLTSIMLDDVASFDYGKKAYPFYRNVDKEGVRICA